MSSNGAPTDRPGPGRSPDDRGSGSAAAEPTESTDRVESAASAEPAELRARIEALERELERVEAEKRELIDRYERLLAVERQAETRTGRAEQRAGESAPEGGLRNRLRRAVAGAKRRLGR